jgi:PAS domain S-box-containing protein
LKESREWLRAVFDASRDGIMVEDDGIIVYANKSHTEMFGYDKQEELVGKKATDILPIEEAERMTEYGKARLRNEAAPPLYEFKLQRRDGSPLYAEASVSTAVIAGKKYIISVTRDISKRKKAEQKIKESEERYRALVSATEQVVWRANAEGEAEFATRSWQKLTGQTDEEMRNWGWLNALHPESRERSEKLWKEALENKGFYEDERRVRTSDGNYRVFQVRGVPVFEEDGQLREWIGSETDITVRKQAEENQLRRAAYIALRADINAAIAESNTSLKKTLNRCAEAILQHLGLALVRIWTLNKNEETLDLKAGAGLNADAVVNTSVPIGTSHIGLIAQERKPRIINDLCSHAKITGAECSVENEMKVFAGYPLIVEDKLLGIIESFSRSELTDDTLDALSSVGDMVSQCIIRKRTEEALRKSENQLRQAQKLESIGRLAGGIAHDFNNMLTAINGYSELALKRLPEDSPVRRNIREIKNAGERSALLTHQLLAFSRQQLLQPKILDINQVIKETVSLLKRLIGEDIHLVTVLDPKTSRVKVDPGQLSQVIMNLVVNARDAMPNGGKLTIETTNIYFDKESVRRNANVSPGNYVMFAVSDNGVGMDEETQQRIFEPFFTTKDIGEGTGLGLATVYGIVKQSGGSISVYSEVGVGTTFKIYFPEIKEKVSEEGKAVSGELPVGNERILLVEDDDSIRALTREILEMYGYKVLTARNGVEALMLCKQENCDFDLLLTDVVMPQMGGRELVKKLTEETPSLRVLFTSGYTDDAVMRHGVIEENTNFLQKPFNSKTLAYKVREILDAKSD